MRSFLAGGYPGERGLNLIMKADGRIISLGSKTAIATEPGVSEN
jgi:N-methylhydantoinase B/oxoprolinase/acetone carboxylase alpha subunit